MAKRVKHEISISRNRNRALVEIAVGTGLRKQRVYLKPEDAAFLGKVLTRWGEGEDTLRYHHVRQGETPPPHS